MARYRFHCTNGEECVFDAVGAQVRTPARLSARAARTADEVMRALPGPARSGAGWSDWWVSVHDLTGRRVLVQPFPSSDDAPALAA